MYAVLPTPSDYTRRHELCAFQGVCIGEHYLPLAVREECDAAQEAVNHPRVRGAVVRGAVAVCGHLLGLWCGLEAP